MLELPKGIMQSNTQISWLATRGSVLSLRALGDKHNSMPYTGVLILRAFGNKQSNIPWFRGYAGVLIPRAFGNKHNNNALVPRLCWGPTTLGAHSPRKADFESMGQKGDLYGGLHPHKYTKCIPHRRTTKI